ncbi:nuclear transport factor 2 family protein [Sphingomonas cavernae]|uniref:Nuclear transport factor 2 family protein n=1 Tax=Sphingomonas cavernae TaxID=2320861 RepID=A0A418WSV6_9SPHN|nr:hypothetical protein D3876_04965 [Sphingomonas cavernae]
MDNVCARSCAGGFGHFGRSTTRAARYAQQRPACRRGEGGRARPVRVLDATETAAVARIDTPIFTDYLQLAKFGDRWLIVNALWVPRPALAAADGEMKGGLQ